jgi:hypothetical protein
MRSLLLLLLLAPGLQAQSIPAAAARALSMHGARWSSRTTEHAVVHALASETVARGIPALAAASERAIAAHLAWLGAPGRRDTLHLVFVGSRSQMRALVGRPVGGWSLPEDGTAFFVANDSVRPAIRHESMHLLSWRVWGTPSAMWLSEGVASLAVGPCRGYTIDDVGAAMARAKALVPLDTLRHAFVVEGERGVAHYLQAASVVDHIDRAYGREALRRLWRTGDIRRSLGVAPAALERRWRASLARSRAPASWDAIRRAIMARGCE